MKQLHGSATANVSASAAECLALLADVERYPLWYPDVVRDVRIDERSSEGLPSRARVALHVAHGPIVRDFDLLMAVSVEPRSVALTRIARTSSDEETFRVLWTVEELTATRFHLALEASLSVPRLLPLGGLGDAISAGFVSAAVTALERPPR